MGKIDENKCRHLAESICEIFRNGLTLSTEVVHFIGSTFSTTSIETLQEIMAEDTDGEMEVLYSLVFFPDITLQEQLEQPIETYKFHETDVQDVLNHLVNMLPETTVHFPDNRGVLHMTMPESIASQFVTRLHIYKRLDNRLNEGICRHVPEDQILRAKVKLRNARFNASENRISFLCEFFEKINDDDGTYLDFILSIFEERQDNGSIYALLQSKKKYYYRNLQKAKRYQEMLNTYNMETLMLRGIRIPHIDPAEEEKKMHLIDRICQAVYGKTEYLLATDDVVEFKSDVKTPSNTQ